MKILLAIGAILLGCQPDPSVSREIRKHRTRATRKIAAMIDAGARVRAMPPVDEERLTLNAGVKLDFRHGPKRNAAFIQLEDLWDLANREPDRLRLDEDTFWPDAVTVLRTGLDTWGRRPTAARVPALFADLDDLRYLFIVRTQAYVQPAVGEGGNPAISPGRWRGDILAFDLDHKVEPIGGLRFAVATSPSVGQAAAAKHNGDMESWLRTHLCEQARAQVGARLARLAPGTRWPPGR